MSDDIIDGEHDLQHEAEARELAKFKRDHPELFVATRAIGSTDEALLRLLDAARARTDAAYRDRSAFMYQAIAEWMADHHYDAHPGCTTTADLLESLVGQVHMGRPIGWKEIDPDTWRDQQYAEPDSYVVAWHEKKLYTLQIPPFDGLPQKKAP